MLEQPPLQGNTDGVAVTVIIDHDAEPCGDVVEPLARLLIDGDRRREVEEAETQ